MAATTEETTRDGYPAVSLTEGDLRATFVPKLGMICASLEHRGDELLGQRNGLASYEARGSTMGIPLLHPWANRLSGFQYEAGGRHVTIDPDSPLVRLDENGLPIHGLVAANPRWDVTDAGDGRLGATLDFGAQPELLEGFPFPHDLRIDATLADGTLRIGTTIRANAGSAVPVSFGFHPYLTLPGVPRPDWHIELPVREHLLTNEHSIPTGRTEQVQIPPGPLGERLYDDGYSDLADPPTFAVQGGGRRIELTFGPGYEFAQVFAPPGQDLICFEPMTAATNALVAGGPGLTTLQPGEERSASFQILVADAG
jgi:galactose mutarotase-like enzyme